MLTMRQLWSRLHCQELPPRMSAGITVLRLKHGPFWNQSYVVGIPGGPAAVIDPAWDVPGILAAAESHNLHITHAIVTHGHHDHVKGLEEIVAATAADVLVHEADAGILLGEFAGQTTLLADGDEVSIGAATATVLHTPGHTAGSICILIGDNLFTGDTLLVGALGRHGAYKGAREQLERSVHEVIGALPASVLVHPGHDEGPKPVAPLTEALPSR